MFTFPARMDLTSVPVNTIPAVNFSRKKYSKPARRLWMTTDFFSGLPLAKGIDVLGQFGFFIGGVVAMNDVSLGEFVQHRNHFAQQYLRLGFVRGALQTFDHVARGDQARAIAQPTFFRLQQPFFGRFYIGHLFSTLRPQIYAGFLFRPIFLYAVFAAGMGQRGSVSGFGYPFDAYGRRFFVSFAAVGVFFRLCET
jgi:hypothetical protein